MIRINEFHLHQLTKYTENQLSGIINNITSIYPGYFCWLLQCFSDGSYYSGGTNIRVRFMR